MAREGRPQLTLRIHPEALRRLKDQADITLPGRPSGVSEMVRRWIYERLDFDSLEWEREQRKEGKRPS
jgi:hypothetical protein